MSERQQQRNTTIERMWGHTRIDNSPAGCWEWTGGSIVVKRVCQHCGKEPTDVLVWDSET